MAARLAAWIDADPDCGAAGAGPVLDGLLPLAAGALRRAGGGAGVAARAGRPQRAAHGTRQRDRRGRSCRTRGWRGRFTIRLAIGNLRTEPRHVERAWELLRAAAARLDA